MSDWLLWPYHAYLEEALRWLLIWPFLEYFTYPAGITGSNTRFNSSLTYLYFLNSHQILCRCYGIGTWHRKSRFQRRSSYLLAYILHLVLPGTLFPSIIHSVPTDLKRSRVIHGTGTATSSTKLQTSALTVIHPWDFYSTRFANLGGVNAHTEQNLRIFPSPQSVQTIDLKNIFHIFGLLYIHMP